MSKRHYMDNLTPVAQNIWKTDDGLFMFSIDGFEINDPCHVSILDTDGSSYVDIPGATRTSRAYVLRLSGSMKTKIRSRRWSQCASW